MENNLQLQYMESSNEVDFLIYEVLDPTPILCTLEENRSKKYQNKEAMQSYCNRIVTCVNAHEELVKALKDIADSYDMLNSPELRNGLKNHTAITLAAIAKKALKKVTDNTPINS